MNDLRYLRSRGWQDARDDKGEILGWARPGPEGTMDMEDLLTTEEAMEVESGRIRS